jgi:hypothetical protein
MNDDEILDKGFTLVDKEPKISRFTTNGKAIDFKSPYILSSTIVLGLFLITYFTEHEIPLKIIKYIGLVTLYLINSYWYIKTNKYD